MNDKPPAAIESIHHVALEVSDLKESIHFYSHVLGFQNAVMPQSVIDNNVHWFQLPGSQMLHLSPRTKDQVFDRSHVALAVENVAEWIEWLKQNNVELVQPAINICQITRQFLRDPSGNLIELVEARSFL